MVAERRPAARPPAREAHHPADRLGRLAIEGAFLVFGRAKELEAQGREVIHCELGEPDFPSPAHVIDAGTRAINDGQTKYTAPAGMPELREALADYARGRGIDAGPGDIVVTSGAKPMLQYALLAVVNPGDEVLVPDTGFPIYPSAVRLADGIVRTYPISLTGGRFQLDFDALRAAITKRTRVIVLNSPHNPSGWTASKADLATLAELVLKHDLWVVSDEIYSGLAYDYPDGAPPSVAAVKELRQRTIIIDGFSKRWAMTGWRLGFGIIPRELVTPVINLVINNTSCTPPFIQRAGVAAVRGPQDCVTALRNSLKARRDRFVSALSRIPGVVCVPPAGAFYAFADVRGVLKAAKMDTETFQRRVLDDHGLAACAGTDFGANGTGFLRFSFATAAPKLDRAVELLHQARAAFVR